MVIRVVRLGSARAPDEGTRVGTVRRPPRGVPKAQFGSGNWYDVWYPTLAPSVDTMKFAQAAQTPEEWAEFIRRYRREMAAPEASRSLDLLAAMSHGANLSVGCYCAMETQCHRSILRALLVERDAEVAPAAL
jgi:uncharacterized protein YeaO (DUF488 family)